MKLFGAGLPRTGTLSQKVALEMAGLGECYHMVNVLGDLSQGAVWRRVLSGETDLREALAGHGASVDWPGGFFYREALEAFPEAKFLLSVRDPQAWERSMRATIWDVLYGDSIVQDLSSARARVDPGWRSYTELMREMWDRAGMAPDCDLAREMERFNQEVIDTIPADRLLVWSVAEGWEPLCEFLEIPVPGAPFPRLNDSASFGERIVDGALLILRQWREAGMPESVASELPA
jgi:hypothetical protein